MPFAHDKKIPPILDKIIERINERGGTISNKDFDKMFYGSPTHTLRITSKEVNDIKRWLHNRGYITVSTRHIRTRKYL